MIELSNKKYLKYLEEFVDVFIKSPIVENSGGMGFNHSYFTYYVMKELTPQLVVESGVWKGHSTYIIESASPNSNIVSLDIDLSRNIYKSKNSKYFETDFNNIDWSSIDGVDDSVCFFDDHQNSLDRLKEMKWWGFKRAIFEDNFPTSEGDSYSLKQIINQSGHPNIQLSKKYLPKTRKKIKERNIEEAILNKFYFRQSMITNPNSIDNSGLNYNVKNIVEFPPIYTGEISYWGQEWVGEYTKAENLINGDIIDKYPNFKKYFSKNQDNFDYGFISFLELN
tara:strand:- start:1850 stop:2692 length:843 start_codon:yes stop_codon:yes gene_type:complete